MKRLISAILCALMLCLFAMPAFAAADDGDIRPPVVDGGQGGPGVPGGFDEPIVVSTEEIFYDVELFSNEDTVTVKWKCQLDEVEEFRVWIANLREKVDDRFFDKKRSVEGNENEFTFTSLEYGRTYYIMIDALVGDESVGRSEIYEIATKLGAPALRTNTEHLISLQYREGYEYRINGGSWRKSNVFTDLDEYTEYVFEWKNTVGEIGNSSKFATLCSHPSTHEEFNDERELMTGVCDVCGQIVYSEQTEHEIHEHVGGEYETVMAASCIREGVSRLFCEICGEIIDEREIAKTSHTYSAEYTDGEGNVVKHCIDCGTVEIVKTKAEEEVPEVDKNVATSGDVTAIIGKDYAFGIDAVFNSRGITDDPGAENVLGTSAYNKAVREIRRQLKCRGLLFYEIGVSNPDGTPFGETAVSIKISTARFTGNTFYVYEILPDGTVNDCGAVNSNGALIFAKRSNGVYAVVDTTGFENNRITSKTWLIVVIAVTVLFLIGAGYAAHYIYSRIRRKKSREWLNDNPDMSDQS